MLTRERISIGRHQAKDGTMVPYLNVGGYEWQPGSVTPNRPDSLAEKRWPIWAEYQNFPMIVWYWDGYFRSSNGKHWGIPLRWFYGRREEEVWNEEKKQWEINGINYTAPPSAPAPLPEAKGEWLWDTIRIIAKHHKIVDVQNVMDMMPWPNDNEGEPEQ